jgi:hypothetical protein
MMAHEILAMKQHKGISVDNVTSSKIETEGYSFWPTPWKTESTSLIETAIVPLDFVGLVFGGFCFTREEKVCWNRIKIDERLRNNASFQTQSKPA